MLELLNQLDGFDSRRDVKVCLFLYSHDQFFFLNISLQVTHADFKKAKDKVMFKKKKRVPEGLHM